MEWPVNRIMILTVLKTELYDSLALRYDLTQGTVTKVWEFNNDRSWL